MSALRLLTTSPDGERSLARVTDLLDALERNTLKRTEAHELVALLRPAIVRPARMCATYGCPCCVVDDGTLCRSCSQETMR